MHARTQTLDPHVRLAVGPAGAFLSCPRRDQRSWIDRVHAAFLARGLAAFPVVWVDDLVVEQAEVEVRFGPSTVRRAWSALDAVWPPFVADIAAPREHVAEPSSAPPVASPLPA